MVWRDMTQEELDAAYDQAVHAPNMDQVLARQSANSRIAREVLGEPLRFRYGPHDMEALDVYPGAAGGPILLFVHGGTWRYGVAADNAYFAETFVRAGVSVVVPDFSSVDEFDGNLEGLVDQLQRAVMWVHAHAGEFGADPERLYLSGFSSGAHLAGVLLTTNWTASGLPSQAFKGALLCSGMYDMTPVAISCRREFVNLRPDNIPLLSPQMNVEKINTPLIVACGTRESPEFQRQAREFAEALKVAGREVQLINATEYNHFEIMETLGSPTGVLGREMLRMIMQP